MEELVVVSDEDTVLSTPYVLMEELVDVSDTALSTPYVLMEEQIDEFRYDGELKSPVPL